MKIFERYRTSASGVRTNTIRESGKKILKQVFEDSGNKMDSSITLPNWQAARFKNAVQVLRLRGANIQDPQTRLLSILIGLAQRKVRRLQCQIHRTKRRNTRLYTYKKISVTWPAEDYNILHAKADHAKISASYILDLAMRLYLDAAIAMLLDQEEMVFSAKRPAGHEWIQKKIKLTSLWRFVCSTGIYQRSTDVSTPARLKYSVDLGPPAISPPALV